MPIVPRVNPAPLPTVRQNGYAPDAAFGGGSGNVTTGINAGLSAVHSEAARIAQEEADRADQIALTDARSQLMGSTTTMLFGPNGALTRNGKDAFTAPEEARAAYFAAVGAIRSSLGNDRQRTAFNTDVNNQWNQINEQVQSHVAQQRRVYDTQTTGAAIENAQNLAFQSYDKPEIIEPLVGGIREDTRAFGARNGWSDDQTKEMIDKRVSDTRFGVLSRLLDDGGDIAAAKYYAAHKGEISGIDQAKIERALGVGSTLGSAQRITDQIVAGKFAPGLVTSGNIDLTNRPRVQNSDGSVSTVRSMSFERDGKEILIPTVRDDGKILTNDEAIAQYDRSGKHLGIFSTADAASAYAQQLHASQAAMLEGQRTPITASAALTQAESIENPKVRAEATKLVIAHFGELDRAQRIDRENARARVLQGLESRHGRLNEASSDWQSINGYAEGEQVLARQHQILHPPPDPGDPDKYNSYVAMAATSPATRQALLTTNIADLVKDATMSGGQKTAVINLIRAERNRDVADVRRQASEAQQEAKHLEQLVKKAQQDGDDDAVENNTPLMYAAQQRATLLRGQLLTANRDAGVGHAAAQGDAAAIAQPMAPERAHPFDPAAFGLGTASSKPLTPDMLRDIATYGPGYADHLRAFGYAVPKVLPKPQPAAAKK